MIEVMIPNLYRDGEYRYILKIKSLDKAIDILENCDGGVKNVIIDCKDVNSLNENIGDIYGKISWIDKLIIKNKKNMVGIYNRNS
ncbi:hypothetical protein [Anaerococcus sp. AGMB09787]|uniref:hypothetical protein n=1 Tax=Anaerococcus sp. AGMB09787 TaxID=2922869 RepID=UPI001FAF1A7C|nr:hypothetical protein [Anaerococcus sp. AGMB09787]